MRALCEILGTCEKMRGKREFIMREKEKTPTKLGHDYTRKLFRDKTVTKSLNLQRRSKNSTRNIPIICT